MIAVKVNNADDKNSPPLLADFTFFGGLYRPAALVITDAVGIAVDNLAVPGWRFASRMYLRRRRRSRPS